jgi:HD superfamily phosphohydrolase YqeK
MFHPLIAAAAEGSLPSWTVALQKRREHVERVRVLMRSWAEKLGLSNSDVDRWSAAGLLHDALRDEDPDVLRDQVPAGMRALPGPVLHGPAAAERLRGEGVDDESLLMAVAFHTLGHPEWDRLGKALCAADFLEPGRRTLAEMRDPMRRRMPFDVDDVVRGIVAARVARQEELGDPAPKITVECLASLEEAADG